MEIALNSDTPGGFKHKNAVASENGLALLASITLKNALNINNNNNTITKSKNNITKDNKNVVITSNCQKKNSIKKHKVSPQQQQLQSFVSSQTTIKSSSLTSFSAAAAATASLSSSLSASTNSNTLILKEQKNVFTFTTAGLQALFDNGAVVVDQQQQHQQRQQTKQNEVLQELTAISEIASSVKNNNNNSNHNTSLSTKNHQTNNTLSAKDPAVALLEGLTIKTNKKQTKPTNQQKQTTGSSSTVTAKTKSSGGNGSNNNSNSSGNGNGSTNKNSYRIPSDILDDLASRFIINVPDMELSNLIRICFQIELAHWFYLDFFCASEEEKKLQPCGIKQFALQLFEHIPFLCQHLSSIDKILEDWKNYKLSVPTYGAILISEDLNYCLLVQSYFAKTSWGFPKGKVNENEDPVHCAAREVYEETGYDITELIVPNDFIEAVINYQYTRLYIVRDVSLDTKFSPRTRNEIKCCDWFPIDSLPVNKNDAISKPKLGLNANSFFMIMPFVKRLKKWVSDKRNGVDTRHKYSNGGSPTSTSPLTTVIAMNGQMKSSCKKQQKRKNSNNLNDEINALNNGGGNGALSNNSCGNNAIVNVNGSNSNRSKRQRHKSMGDLDGIKLNNFNNNNKINCKLTNNNNNNNNNNCSSTKTTSALSATTTANSGGNLSCNNINANTNSNQKRLSKIVAAGSSLSNTINNNTNNGCNNNNNINNGSNIPSKRQLFQSQSQTNNIQQNGEKVISSFDLIRKEKQQAKAALAKAQKEQQSLNNSASNGRQRAKSQSDKMCVQQQQQQPQQQLPSQQKSTVNCNKQQNCLQKQQSLIVTNSNMQNYNACNNYQNNINIRNKNHNNNNNNVNAKSNVNNNCNNNMTTGVCNTPTPPPINGNDLLALAAAAATVTPVAQKTTIATTVQVNKSRNCDQEKPRPSSVSLHFPEVSSIEKVFSDTTATNNQMPQFKRMASGTNLKILRRSTSHQSTQPNHQQHQQPQRQASALQFTPSFNSWTNFTFTKNFIANVFC